MISEMVRRKYRQKRRAEQQEQTRARIVQATMELHEELGPARTTISAIAERAGVERLTVYRHFPDDRELFKACSGRFLELHPPPDAANWGDADAPQERARSALLAFYRYYRRTAAMWRNVYRDIDLVRANAEVTREFEAWVAGIRDDLVKAYRPATAAKRRAVRGVLGHALRFSTWESLDREGFGDEAKVSSILRWVDACRNGRPGWRA